MNRILLATAASTLALAACNNNGAANNDVHVDNLTVNSADLGNASMTGNATASTSIDGAFLTDAMKGDNSEVTLGKMAEAKGASQAVKDFGSMLATDHGAHKTEVAALAQQNGVAVTDDMMDEAKTEQTKLDGLSGAAFDKEFARYMVDDHNKDIAKFEAQAKSGDPQTAALANKTVPALRKHLEAAKKLQK